MRKTINILVFALLLLLIPVFANAAIIDGGECGSGVTWTLDDTGLLVISGSGNMTDSPWQKTHQLDIKQVVINQGIKNISERAFNWCKNLENVAIPDSVTVIGGYSFNYCSKLKNLSIPSSVTSIESGAFEVCEGLETITIPESVVKMGSWVFSHCTGLKTVNYNANCSFGLNYYNFGYCTELEKINIPSSNSMYCSIDGVVYSKDKKTTILYPEGKRDQTYEVIDGVTDIGENTFRQNKYLTSVKLPDSLEQINQWAFGDCTSLESIHLPQGLRCISSEAFINCALSSLELPVSLELLIENAFDHKTVLIAHEDSYATKWTQEQGYNVTVTDHTLNKIDKKEPTTTEDGYEEHWKCNVCEKLFSDSEGKTEISAPVIIPKLARPDISEAKISKIPDQVYTGKSIKPELTVTYEGRILIEGEDYTVKWKNNKKIGKATVIITERSPIGRTKTATFKILPKPTELSSLKAGKKSLTVKWKKGSKIDGYEIQYSLKSNFKSAKKITISGASTKKAEIDGLKKKKTYYVRIRTYKENDGKKYYSEWSEAMVQKTK